MVGQLGLWEARVRRVETMLESTWENLKKTNQVGKLDKYTNI